MNADQGNEHRERNKETRYASEKSKGQKDATKELGKSRCPSEEYRHRKAQVRRSLNQSLTRRDLSVTVRERERNTREDPQ